jgi:hypothetical protein
MMSTMGFVLESRDGSSSFELSDLELDEDGNAAYVKVRIVDSGLAASARLTLNTYQNDALQLSNPVQGASSRLEGLAGQEGVEGTREPLPVGVHP